MYPISYDDRGFLPLLSESILTLTLFQQASNLRCIKIWADHFQHRIVIGRIKRH